MNYILLGFWPIVNAHDNLSIIRPVVNLFQGFVQAKEELAPCPSPFPGGRPAGPPWPAHPPDTIYHIAYHIGYIIGPFIRPCY